LTHIAATRRFKAQPWLMLSRVSLDFHGCRELQNFAAGHQREAESANSDPLLLVGPARDSAEKLNAHSCVAELQREFRRVIEVRQMITRKRMAKRIVRPVFDSSVSARFVEQFTVAQWSDRPGKLSVRL